MNDKIKIGVALGGGAVKGFAHIGVLQVLEENGIKPSFVAGTSMGSLIGALYSFGLTPIEMENLSRTIRYNSVVDLNVIMHRGILVGNKLKMLVEQYTNNAMIQNLKIPFRAVAIDLISGKQFVFEKGSVSEAVRASCSVPGVFEAVKKDDMLLVDGGLLNNVPSDVVKQMGADFVISVDVVGDYTAQLPTRSLINVLLNSFNVAICNNEKQRKKHHDHLIKLTMPDVKVEVLKQENIVKAIEYGRKIAKEQISKILTKIKNFKK